MWPLESLARRWKANINISDSSCWNSEVDGAGSLRITFNDPGTKIRKLFKNYFFQLGGSPKDRSTQTGIGDVQQTWRAITPKPKQPHMPYVSVMIQLNQDLVTYVHVWWNQVTTLRKILYFIGGTGLLAEWERWGCTIDQKMVEVQGSRCKGRLTRQPHLI
jgi:hypothetical protein